MRQRQPEEVTGGKILARGMADDRGMQARFLCGGHDLDRIGHSDQITGLVFRKQEDVRVFGAGGVQFDATVAGQGHVGHRANQAAVRQVVDAGQATGLDQDEVAAETGLSREAIVALMTGAPLTVLAVGFLPGFPFCGPVPDVLTLPRRKTPRLRVPPGSLAIANGFAGIYPWESPGGWRILGHCPLPLFDPRRDAPALLAPGDSVRIEAVDAAEHARLRAALAAREIGPDAFAEAAR